MVYQGHISEIVTVSGVKEQWGVNGTDIIKR